MHSYKFTSTGGGFSVRNATTGVETEVINQDGTLNGSAIIDDGSITATKLASNAVETAKIKDANVTLGKLAAGITPSHVVKFASNYTTTGGAAAEAITITGAAATDIPFVTLQDDGTNNVTIKTAVVTLNTLTITFSADPGNDTKVSYMLLRAAA